MYKRQVYKYNQKHPESAIRIRGHVFTWHSQTPEWFFHVDYDKDKELCSKAVSYTHLAKCGGKVCGIRIYDYVHTV